MIKSLRTKFLLLLFFTSMVSLTAAFFLRGLIINDFRKYLEGEMEDRVYWVTADLEGAYEKHHGWKEEVIVEDTVWALLLGLEINILDPRGTPVMNTRGAIDSLSPLMKKRIMAISGYPPKDRTGELYPYPLFLGGESIGRIEVRFLKPGRETIFIRRSNQFLLLSLLALGGLSVVLSIVFSRKLAKPLKEITLAAGAIREGNFKSRVEIRSGDEISELARDFNSMAHSLEIQESLRKRLTSNIAHELRTPLAVMRGELEGMIDGLIAPDKEQLHSLYEETGRLNKILEGIEDLTAAEASAVSLRKEPIELKPFLTNIAERFMMLFSGQGVILECVCDDGMIVAADPDRLSQVVINLLSNALKATEKGGHVWIKAGRKETDTVIEVRDTGCGIKREDLPFLFVRFYRSAKGGLGLGLAIVKELVEAHGGRIEVQSEYGKGAVFTLYLPHDSLHNFS